jgi:hypothetical protein
VLLTYLSLLLMSLISDDAEVSVSRVGASIRIIAKPFLADSIYLLPTIMLLASVPWVTRSQQSTAVVAFVVP